MNYSVLIVEDDPMVSMINEQYVLKCSDFIIAGTCRNGQEAIEFLKAQKADLILLDVFMPVMNGVETLKKIRELQISSDVIMITAANDTTTIEETMHLGVLDYLIKPFAYERFNVSLQKFKNKMHVMEGNQNLDQKSLDSLISNKTTFSIGRLTENPLSIVSPSDSVCSATKPLVANSSSKCSTSSLSVESSKISVPDLSIVK